MMSISEEVIENSIIKLLEEQNYQYINKHQDDWLLKRQDKDFKEFINFDLLFTCMKKINHFQNDILTNDGNKLSEEQIDEIIKEAIDKLKLKNDQTLTLFEANKKIHEYLIDGVYINRPDCRVNPLVKFIDFNNVDNNIFQVTNQFELVEIKQKRIPDVVVFINGIPLVIMELKSFDENGSQNNLIDAYNQLGNNTTNSGYRFDIPSIFKYNAFLVISDGVASLVGTLTSKITRFNEWKKTEFSNTYDNKVSQTKKLQTLIAGLFNKATFLDVLKNGIFFIQKDNKELVKIINQYHQYYGVKKAKASIDKALKPTGNGLGGILWHTQGSGKSFSMVMLAHRLLVERVKISGEYKVPTIVVLTDRNDLDDQLVKTFDNAADFLRSKIVQVGSRKQLLNVLRKSQQGKVILTTIHKFSKEEIAKNENENIIVMVDEAHRSHYGMNETISYKVDEETGKTYAEHNFGIEKYIRESLPNATFIGFTGTPIETNKKQTTEVYGSLIDIYDMTQSVADGSTVPISYEHRLLDIKTLEDALDKIDSTYDEIENSKSLSWKQIEQSKRKLSRLQSIFEDPDLIETLANDILDHYKNFLNGKVMVVTETRAAAIKLFKKLQQLAEEKFSDKISKDQIIVVATTSNKDSAEDRYILGSKEERKEKGTEFKKDNSKYKIAVVCDMWLTGFDVPDLETMYFIKRLKAHNLMQAIARVNRVYPGKTSGLLVDYLGIKKYLDEARNQYTNRDLEKNFLDVAKSAYPELQKILVKLNQQFAAVNTDRFDSNDGLEVFEMIQSGANIALKTKESEIEFLNYDSYNLKRLYNVCRSLLTAKEDLKTRYYLGVRSFIQRLNNTKENINTFELDKKILQLRDEAIKVDEVKILNKYETTPEEYISILNKDYLNKTTDKFKGIAKIKVLTKAIAMLIETSRTSLEKSKKYSKHLKDILNKYKSQDEEFDINNTIYDLTKFANEILEEKADIEAEKLDPLEEAFYQVLKTESVKRILSDNKIRQIAKELKEILTTYYEEHTDDIFERNSKRAAIRVKIKEQLEKYDLLNKNFNQEADLTEKLFSEAQHIYKKQHQQ
ncbi:type I restriction endonuclease subunit R [[Mycoplasma] falconis]|uniref:Type I restriction enzyme endonuclease subunit n=1 Tax=[Mycoplasma] falconis TaxID=92403 RepID=A0A501XAP5_9BACT|nr:type I restriction endonuclease subunit R [[Mycoplasma] falconis]TPE57374.1 type I restriction endonuclease subunit R [[Mycoplasma] falconis]